MKHTRVPWDGTQGFGGQLSRHYRYQAFAFFEAESGIKLKVKSKTGKSRMDRTYRETETQKTKKSTYLSHAEVFKPGQIDEVQCVRKIRTFLLKKKTNDRRNSICFIRYFFRPNTSAFDTQTLYQHQSALPYMGCCILPCSFIKEPMILGPIPQSRWRKKTWKYCPWWWLVMVVTPKMKFGRPII